MSKYTILTEEEINSFTTEHLEWSVEEGKLVAEFKLPSFDHAIEVINAVATKASEIDHHPEMTNVFNILRFAMNTHDAGDVITDLDRQMAEFISICSRELREL